jgi:hypothetical protein
MTTLISGAPMTRTREVPPRARRHEVLSTPRVTFR